MTRSPLWLSAFRPFYLLGAAYAPVLAIAWLAAWLGYWSPPGDVPLRLTHGHEFIFGFAVAIVFGVVLTALPSWAGTDELDGGRLALLAGLWLAGRAGFWSAPWLPAPLPGVLDGLLYAAAIVMLAPQLARVKNRRYALLLPILAALLASNLVFHHAIAGRDAALASLALRGAVWTLAVLFVLKGGVLAPIFTGNALRERGRGDQAPFLPGLEFASVAALVLLAALDLAGAPPRWTGTLALACAVLHGWRCARWRGWRVADVPLLLAMHLGFAWLLAALLLKAAADLFGLVPEAAWLHAFTVGGLGMMMLGLMTRVVLRHTGRPLVVPLPLRVAMAAMFLAALLRVGAGPLGTATAWAIAAALLWGACFALYLAVFGRTLTAPSLPRPAP